MDPEKLVVPFTPEQVLNLNGYQQDGFFHPFTCGNKEKNDEDHPDRGVLVATIKGWICPFCDYKQDWAHKFMAAPAAERMDVRFEGLKAMKKSMKENL